MFTASYKCLAMHNSPELSKLVMHPPKIFKNKPKHEHVSSMCYNKANKRLNKLNSV